MSRAAPKKRYTPVPIGPLALLIVFVVSLFTWTYSSKASVFSNGELRVWMFDIGQGDAFFIEFPTGEQWLIDGGPDDAVLAKLGSVLAPWDRTLEAIVLTHPDADHVTGLVSVLDRYEVATIYESGALAHTPPGKAFADRVGQESAEHVFLQTGDTIKVGDVRLTVLWPDEDVEGRYPENRNDLSLNILLSYGETTILLTGDAESDTESIVGPRVGDVDVLKVGHHGSLTSSSWEFLQRTQPEIALISMGRDNSYGHPHPVVISRFEQVGAQIVRTDIHRDVLLISDGGEPQMQPHPLPF